eukprot:20900-Ditylum_brightwellii.AAC.1
MEESKYMGKAQRRVIPVKSTGSITSLVQKGRRQAEKDSSLSSLCIKRHSATVRRSNGAWEKESHMDVEMETVEEKELDLSMPEEKHTKATEKNKITLQCGMNRDADESSRQALALGDKPREQRNNTIQSKIGNEQQDNNST